MICHLEKRMRENERDFSHDGQESSPARNHYASALRSDGSGRRGT